MTRSKTHLSWSVATKGHSGESSFVSERDSRSDGPNLRLGLCCQFIKQPIRFRTSTATSLMRLPEAERRLKLSRICLSNAQSLLAALRFCIEHGIGCFRIDSQILPVKTHPTAGYSLSELPAADAIVATFHFCRRIAGEHNLRVVFHPDQFVVLNSPREDVVEKSIKELEYQAEVAEWVGADVINIHGGGAYGDKAAALARFARNLDRLSDAVRSRLTIENDDKVYTPKDLLPLCRAVGVPLVYDVHHHRCLPDGLTIEQATDAVLCTWGREPLFHISSPLEGWSGPKLQRHHDYIDLGDFPDCWRQRCITVEVEARAKELAVLRLRDELFRPVASSSRRPSRTGATR
jgi:UV DNA damage endonuclease